LLKGIGKVVSVGLGAVSKVAEGTTVGKVTGFVSKIIAPKTSAPSTNPVKSAVVTSLVKTIVPDKQPDSKGVKVEPMPAIAEAELTGVQKKVFAESKNLTASASVSFGKGAAVKKGSLTDMNLSSSDPDKSKGKTPWAAIVAGVAFVVGVLLYMFSRKRKR